MSTISRKLPTAGRLLLGLVFFVFGLDGFLHFMPHPPMPPAAGAFLGGLASSGYFFTLLKATEVTAGAALLANRFVPLALAVLAPIVVNIAAFHLLLAPNPVMVLLLLGLEIGLAWAYRDAFRPMLRARVAATPAHGDETIADRASAVAE